MNVVVVHGFGDKETELTYDLWNEVLPEESFVQITERKVHSIIPFKFTGGSRPEAKVYPELATVALRPDSGQGGR